jgi:type VI secretion system protein ImpF
MSHNALSFYIEAELWAQPIPLRLFLKTEIDLEAGSAQVIEAGSG